MNVGIWKKKPLKKELVDIIKIQEEEISRLNKEKMNFNVVIRNEKPIRIDTQGLDYMVDLEQKYYELQNIIKEVREYITNKYDYLLSDDTFLDHDEKIDSKQIKHILEILDKENK